MSLSGGPSPAEHHLGDRLAALVDGELGHDARERVLAHLATCGKCKAEADAQRRLKSVFAQAAPPGPSEGLLARLQGLPGGDPGSPVGRLGEGGLGRGDFARGGGPFGYAPGSGHGSGSGRRADRAMPGLAAQPRQRGFRVHEAERPAPQRRRFAFAAAGAVSLAAFALGGALPLEAAVDTPGGRTADAGGTAVTPLSATPAAGSDPLARSGEVLAAAEQARTGTGRQRGVPTVAPAPSAMSLFAPGAAFSHRAPAPHAAGRFGLSPLIAGTAPASPYHFPPVTAEPGKGSARGIPPLPPLEPKRPLTASAAPVGPAVPDTAPGRR
ncbi:zf-HC2 domain-containing protein [Streptomyces sp. NPDC048650]|uniref:zf-HC2 domain-containing protein n=1 Tax=unclassified Streptomyces TaxID=2593676 RepID=UPI003717C431